MQRSNPQPPQDSTADIIYLVDRLEELVGIGKRVPFSGRVMVEELEFLGLVDQLREAVPQEIKQAQRVIRERERIISEAQDEAIRIVQVARDRADSLVAQHNIVNEARVQGEEILRASEERSQRTRGELDMFAIEQLQLVEDAIRRGMAVMEDAVEHTLDTVNAARDAVGS